MTSAHSVDLPSCVLVYHTPCILSHPLTTSLIFTHHPHHPPPTMPLQCIVWNDIYCHKPGKRTHRDACIAAHYRTKLGSYESVDVFTIVPYIFISLTHPFSWQHFRGTRWHRSTGETWPGHLTIQFFTEDGHFLATEHVKLLWRMGHSRKKLYIVDTFIFFASFVRSFPSPLYPSSSQVS